ncbi:hypothetical protein MHYP_G00091160 [Metynnis hypsauchen]
MMHHHSNGAKKARERRRKERRQKPKQLHIFSEGLRLRSIEHGSTGGWIAQRSTLEKVMKDKQSSPESLTKRRCRPSPKFVDASDVEEEASMPKKRRASGVEFDTELLEKIKLRCGPVFPASPTLAGPLLPA